MTPAPENIKLHLVCYENVDDWILGKFARKLLEGAKNEGIECTLGGKPDPTADVNHHICYTLYDGKPCTTETVMITHVNTDEKLQLVRAQMPAVEMGICMSAQTMQMLGSRGLPRSKLCFISPACDETIRPRKIIIGITHRIYTDGRKREHMLLDLASKIFPDDFKFRIMGPGWEPIIAQLRSLNFEVEFFSKFERCLYEELLCSIDYYLYFAMDEGSMGFVDALAAGLPTIVTAQGFHLDAQEAITHKFTTIEQLVRIFSELAAKKRTRQNAVKDWTWSNYVCKHILLWRYALSRKVNPRLAEPLLAQLNELGVDLSSGIVSKLWRHSFSSRR
jgi:hypothetical protein